MLPTSSHSSSCAFVSLCIVKCAHDSSCDYAKLLGRQISQDIRHEWHQCTEEGLYEHPPPPPPPGESSCSNSEIKLGEGNYLLTSSMPPWFGHGRVPGRDRHWWVHCFCQTTVLQNQRGLYFEIGQLREEINSPTWVLVRSREESLYSPIECLEMPSAGQSVLSSAVLWSTFTRR